VQLLCFGCLRCQRYEFWKQFTTGMLGGFALGELFTMSKIRILKAIHNITSIPISVKYAVYDVKDTNFESNSQPYSRLYTEVARCLRCQRYEFWKQFTTANKKLNAAVTLFTMSKIRILKAIHN